MTSNNTARTIAFLASNGVDEAMISTLQRAISTAPFKATIKIISTERSLIQTWAGADWGFSMAVNEKVDTALSADFDALVVCGTQRSIDKLAMNPHSTRFVEGFYNSSKPIICADEGIEFIKDILLEPVLNNVLQIENSKEESDIASKVFDFIATSESDIALAA